MLFVSLFANRVRNRIEQPTGIDKRPDERLGCCQFLAEIFPGGGEPPNSLPCFSPGLLQGEWSFFSFSESDVRFGVVRRFFVPIARRSDAFAFEHFGPGR